MTSTLKTDVIESKTTDGDLTIQGAGTGVPNLEAGFKVGGTAGVPISDLRATGTATHVLTSNGGASAPTFQAAAAGGLTSVQVFTATGTWTKPAGVGSVRVQLVGGGAAGNHSGMGGGAGGYSEEIIDVSSVSTVAVTVAAAVAGNAAGNTSSFGAYLSATGGALGTSSTGGLGGVGTGGDINTYGGGGDYHDTGASGAGGSSYFGGGQQGRGSTFGTNTAAYLAYGGGGIGVYNGYTQGAMDVGGLVVVWEYK